MHCIIDTIFPPAYLNATGKSSAICTANNVTKWVRYKKTKIKNEFKNILKEWYIPEPDVCYDFIEVHFTALRNSNRKLDSDALSISSYKWSLDTLVEMGYIIDDDKVKIVLHPTKLKKDLDSSVEQNVETLIHMQVYERLEYE